MFRRLYWVTEILNEDGKSRVAGVYTSIPDLIRRGIPKSDASSLRVTLTKLDSDKAPFGSWCGPDFAGLEEACQQFIRTDEFGEDEVNRLGEALRHQARMAA